MINIKPLVYLKYRGAQCETTLQMIYFIAIISFERGFYMNNANKSHHQEEQVLTKALCNLVKFYSLTGKDLSKIIGISESSASRLGQGKKLISPDTKEGEMALLLLRIYRSLNAMVGNNHEKAKLWLNSQNKYFRNKPIKEMETIPGLIGVLNYLDAMRGKL
jgi:plasmid maintenance system antidote protein VapI